MLKIFQFYKELQRADSRAQRACVFHQILEENDFESKKNFSDKIYKLI